MHVEVGTLVVAGASTGFIYGLIALGFNIIYKATDAINFAQGEWVMMGGMIAAALSAGGHLPLWQACVAAVLIVGSVGVLTERVVMRQLRRATPLLVTLVSIGVAICSKSLIMLTLGKNPAGFPAFSGDRPVVVGGLSVHPQSLWIMGITLAVMILTHLYFGHTVLGRSMRAAAADPEAASLVGIDPHITMMLSFCLAAAVGATAGVIITPLTLTSFDQGTVLGFKGFSAAMLGGLGSLSGAVAGGLLLGLVESLASGMISSAFKDATAFLVLLGVLFLRPSGLFGRGHVERV